MEWLGRAYDLHMGRLAYLRIEPMFAPLHGNPEFRALLQKIGLPEGS